MKATFENCQRLKKMSSIEAVQAMAKLAQIATGGRPLALGLWNGTMTGGESGREYTGEHVAVFSEKSLFAAFGPHGDREGEAGAALCVLAARHAEEFARLIELPKKVGSLEALCKPVMAGYAQEKSAMDSDMLPLIVALADEAEEIERTERSLFRAQAVMRAMLSAFDSSESRNPERSPIQSAALRGVYEALGMPWPAEG